MTRETSDGTQPKSKKPKRNKKPKTSFVALALKVIVWIKKLKPSYVQFIYTEVFI